MQCCVIAYKLQLKIHPLTALKQKKYNRIKHYLFKREYNSIIDQSLPVPLTLHTKITPMAVVLYSSCFINSPKEPPPSIVANESVPTSRSHLVNIVDFSSTRDDNWLLLVLNPLLHRSPLVPLQGNYEGICTPSYKWVL